MRKINEFLGNSYSNLATGSRSMSASSATNLYFYYPWGLGYAITIKLLCKFNNGQVHVLEPMVHGLKVLVELKQNASCS